MKSVKDDASEWPLLAYTLLSSVGLSSLAAWLCMVFGGAGHAAISPGLLYFGPLAAFGHVVPLNEATMTYYINLRVIAAFGYYGFYGAILWLGRVVHHAKLALAGLLVFHYLGVLVCWFSPNWDGLSNLGLISQIYGGWIIILLVELFIVLHVLAWQYVSASGNFPLRWSRWTLAILMVGLVLGWLTHLLTRMPAS